MEYALRSQWDLRFYLVALLCLASATFGSIRLWEDFNTAAGVGGGAVMGQVLKREARVRRKPRSSYIWSNVQANEALYLRDSVQTDAASAATISLKDGTVLEVGENSLIVIDDVENMAMNFVKGQVIVRKSNGEDTKLSVGADGKTIIEQIPVRITSPETLSHHFISKSASTVAIDVRWEAINSGATTDGVSFEVEYAPSSKFVASETKVFSARGKSAKLELPVGTYFLRVRQSEKIVSGVTQVFVDTTEILRTSSPSSNATVRLFRDSIVEFRWVVPKHALPPSTHHVSVARDAEFEDIVARNEIAVESGIARVGLPKDGRYFWRIESTYGANNVSSVPTAFRAERFEKAQIEVLAPEAKSAFPAQKPLRLSWRSDASDLEYLVKISRIDVEDHRIDVVSQKTTTHAYVIERPSPGHYEWTIQATYRGEVVGATEARSFSVFDPTPLAASAPSDGATLYYWEKPTDFEFKWASDELLKSTGGKYRLEVASDQAFKNIVVSKSTIETVLTAFDIELKPGQYFWRVLLTDSIGQIAKSTAVFRFTYGVHPVLPAPQTLSPQADHFFKLTDLDQELVFTWAPVENAVSYVVTVTEQSAKLSQPRVFAVKEAKSSIRVSKAAEYTWSVVAVDRIGRRGESTTTRKLSVTYGDTLPAPESVSPEVQ